MDTFIENSFCRCCSSEGTFKDVSTKYHWMGEEEIYADMLKECFNIILSTAEESRRGICELCISQLRSAANFKKQVLHTENQFKKMLENKQPVEDTIEFVIKSELETQDGDVSDDNDNVSDTGDPDYVSPDFDVSSVKEETEEPPRPTKRAAQPSTSRAKKPKTEQPETSAKRVIGVHPLLDKVLRVRLERIDAQTEQPRLGARHHLKHVKTLPQLPLITRQTSFIENQIIGESLLVDKLAHTALTQVITNKADFMLHKELEGKEDDKSHSQLSTDSSKTSPIKDIDRETTSVINKLLCVTLERIDALIEKSSSKNETSKNNVVDLINPRPQLSIKVLNADSNETPEKHGVVDDRLNLVHEERSDENEEQFDTCKRHILHENSQMYNFQPTVQHTDGIDETYGEMVIDKNHILKKLKCVNPEQINCHKKSSTIVTRIELNDKHQKNIVAKIEKCGVTVKKVVVPTDIIFNCIKENQEQNTNNNSENNEIMCGPSEPKQSLKCKVTPLIKVKPTKVIKIKYKLNDNISPSRLTSKRKDASIIGKVKKTKVVANKPLLYKNYICDVCSANFVNKRLIINHMVTHEEKPTKVIKIKDKLNDNISPSRLADKRKDASIIGKVKNTKVVANKPLLYKNYIGDVCSANFVKKCAMVNHMAIHEEKHECVICRKKYCNKSVLSQHVRNIHINKTNRQELCELCGAKFTDEMPKNDHMKKKHGWSSCNSCNKIFRVFSKLQEHIKRDHLLEKNYKCAQCEYKSFTRYDIKNHMVKHTGVKKFSCDLCSLQFGRRGSLVNHIRIIHENVRKYECEVCHKKFPTNYETPYEIQ